MVGQPSPVDIYDFTYFPIMLLVFSSILQVGRVTKRHLSHSFYNSLRGSGNGRGLSNNIIRATCTVTKKQLHLINYFIKIPKA